MVRDRAFITEKELRSTAKKYYAKQHPYFSLPASPDDVLLDWDFVDLGLPGDHRG